MCTKREDAVKVLKETQVRLLMTHALKGDAGEGAEEDTGEVADESCTERRCR